jgi:hypothetical protein
LDIKNRQAEKGYILFAFRAESVWLELDTEGW